MSCEKLPNPLSECELNTYLQCWEQDCDCNKDVEITFTNIGEALRVLCTIIIIFVFHFISCVQLSEEIQCILKDKYVPSVTDKHKELLDEVNIHTQI